MMSYEPNREKKSELMSAWNSVSQDMGHVRHNSNVYLNETLELNTIGEGDAVIESHVLTPQDSLYGYFTGDLRIDTTTTPNIYGDLFTITFAQNDGATNSGGNTQRANRTDDQCYSIASSAKLIVGNMLRLSGDTIAPYVRVLGVLIEE